MFGRQPKVVLRFRVITYGDEFGKEVRKYYNATKLIRPYGKNGRFKVGFSSDLLRDFSRLHGKVSRLDRIPMTRFDDCIIAGEIATAMQGHDQQPIPADLQYSVVRKLIAVTARGQGSKNVAPEPAPKPTPTRNGGRP